MRVFVTGAAGFIGFHTAKQFLESGHDVVGYDGFTPYYSVQLKRDRAAILNEYHRFSMIEAVLEDVDALKTAVEQHQPEIVIHLAAQAGVRYSIDNPSAYISSNLVGTANLLEALRYNQPKHFLFGSTSSVYGSNPWQPFGETDRTDFPASLYAATKRGCEALTHSYAHLYDIPTTCFRFFTVYGPWGRPDMALFKFVERMKRDDEIEVYGDGNMFRDFTYVDDLITAIANISGAIPQADTRQAENDSVSPTAPWRVVNLAGGSPQSLGDFIETIEARLGQKARRKLLPMQPGDVVTTNANPALLNGLAGAIPQTSLEAGVDAFVTWYESYFADEG